MRSTNQSYRPINLIDQSILSTNQSIDQSILSTNQSYRPIDRSIDRSMPLLPIQGASLLHQIFCHLFVLLKLLLTPVHTYIHTYIHTYKYTYIQTRGVNICMYVGNNRSQKPIPTYQSYLTTQTHTLHSRRSSCTYQPTYLPTSLHTWARPRRPSCT